MYVRTLIDIQMTNIWHGEIIIPAHTVCEVVESSIVPTIYRVLYMHEGDSLIIPLCEEWVEPLVYTCTSCGGLGQDEMGYCSACNGSGGIG